MLTGGYRFFCKDFYLQIKKNVTGKTRPHLGGETMKKLLKH